MIKVTYSAPQKSFFVDRITGFGSKGIVMLAAYQKNPPELPFQTETLEDAIDRALYAINTGEVLKISDRIVNLDAETGVSLKVLSSGDEWNFSNNNIIRISDLIAKRLRLEILAIGFPPYAAEFKGVKGRITFLPREGAENIDLTGRSKLVFRHHNLDGHETPDPLLASLVKRMPPDLRQIVVYANKPCADFSLLSNDPRMLMSNMQTTLIQAINA